MALEPIGDIANTSMTEAVPADPSQAQMLARMKHPAETIAALADVSASVAQMNERRQRTR